MRGNHCFQVWGQRKSVFVLANVLNNCLPEMCKFEINMYKISFSTDFSLQQPSL